MNTKVNEPLQAPKIRLEKNAELYLGGKEYSIFLFLAALAVIYIYNGHFADKLTRRASNTEKHIKELEYEYKTVKSEVIFRSKASELIKAVAPLGLKEPTSAPILLVDSIKKQ
jgi:hypothetical protein